MKHKKGDIPVPNKMKPNFYFRILFEIPWFITFAELTLASGNSIGWSLQGKLHLCSLLNLWKYDCKQINTHKKNSLMHRRVFLEELMSLP